MAYIILAVMCTGIYHVNHIHQDLSIRDVHTMLFVMCIILCEIGYEIQKLKK